jgi:acyl carrier protein
MIPSYFIFLDKIPLTANGKVDRKALPEPGIESGGKYAAPRDELEKKLEEIWAEVLSHPTIGIDDNFFEIGGHSLKATLAIIRIHKELGREVPLAQIFKTPTIRGLSGYIKRETGTNGIFRPVESAEKRDYYPLSPAQEGLYVHQALDRESTAYNGLRVVTIEGEPRMEKLETAVMKLVRRHENLRTSFHMVDDEPVQKIHETVEFGLEFYDLAPGEKKKTVTDFVRPFDLTGPPLVRVGLGKLEQTRYILLIDMHHIITDGVSHYIFVKEFIALYRGEELPPLRIHYKDYSLWMNTPGIREALERQEAFWLKRFRGSVPGLRMPYDYERPAIKRYEGGSLTFEIDAALTARLNRLAKETETTMFMVLLAAYYMLLWKYTGQEDIVVGSPITGRSHVDLQHIMGMFVNMLALRSRPRADKTVKEFLMEIKESVLLSMENQDYHFEELAVALGLQGNPGRNPLFDVVFAMNNHDFVNVANHDFGDADSGSLRISDYDVHQNVSRFDLLIGAFENTDANTGDRTIRMAPLPKGSGPGTLPSWNNWCFRVIGIPGGNWRISTCPTVYWRRIRAHSHSSPVSWSLIFDFDHGTNKEKI